MKPPFQFNDGGREASGIKARGSRDCVARAVAIASGRPYAEIYDALAAGNAGERTTKRGHRSSGKATASNGIATGRKWFKDFMRSLGFQWVPTMQIGTGCKVHVCADELPAGRLVLSLSRHFAAFIDGTLHDNHDSSRDGSRCVYGYWVLPS